MKVILFRFASVLISLVAVAVSSEVALRLFERHVAAGLTQMGVHYREPYPEFLKPAMEGVEPFHSPDDHFNAAGHALFAKFLTDTDLARASTDYYAHR